MLRLKLPSTARIFLASAAALVGLVVVWSFVARPAFSRLTGLGHQAWVDLAAGSSVVAVSLTVFLIMERVRRMGLATADQRLHELLDLTTDAILSIDRDLRIVRFNRAAQRMFGYREDQAIGQCFSLLLPADSHERYRRHLRRFVISARLRAALADDHGLTVCHQTGRAFPVAVHLTKSIAGSGDQITIAVQDIGARRAAEAKLDWERNLMSALMEAWPDFIFAKDTGGRFIVANAKTAELMGAVSADALIGRSDFDFYPAENAARLHETEQELMRSGVAQIAVPMLVESPTAGNIWLSNTKIPFRDKRGKVVGLVGVVRDITIEKLNEATLSAAKEQAELSNRAKSEFLANMSHELRTPLNAIIGFSEIIRQETMGPLGTAVYGEYAGDINEAGIHLLAIINDILDLSKIESGNDELLNEETNVADLVDSVARLLSGRAAECGVTIAINVPAGLPLLSVDRRKLKQVLANMLSNAVKFTERGGRVELRVWCEDQRDFFLQVSDNGIGMAPDDIPVALAQFGQVDSRLARQHEGTGLGLPLSKALIELHGGDLQLHSELGVGTTATVFLPDRAVPVTGRASA